MKRRRNCDGAVCCLGFLSLVPGLNKTIVSKVAFFPPSPPGYLVTNDTSVESAQSDDCDSPAPSKSLCATAATKSSNSSLANTKTVYLVDVGQFSFAYGRHHLFRLPSIDVTAYGRINIKHVEISVVGYGKIHAFHLTRADASHTLIYSHGNATDAGIVFPWILELCRFLRVNVLAYDYNSYGASEGSGCGEEALIADITAVYDYLTSPVLGLSASQLILYGHSIGSAPSIYLASQIQTICGLIIHSGMKSGLTALKPDYPNVHWFDAFKNIEKIKDVQCPIFIIHGCNDRDIGIEHGVALYEAARRAECWWVEGCHHNDVEILYRDEYFAKLEKFLSSIGCYSHTERTHGFHLTGRTRKESCDIRRAKWESTQQPQLRQKTDPIEDRRITTINGPLLTPSTTFNPPLTPTTTFNAPLTPTTLNPPLTPSTVNTPLNAPYCPTQRFIASLIGVRSAFTPRPSPAAAAAQQKQSSNNNVSNVSVKSSANVVGGNKQQYPDFCN